MKTKYRKIRIIKLDIDDCKKIKEFIKLWKELKPEVEEVFVSKDIKFKGSKE